MAVHSSLSSDSTWGSFPISNAYSICHLRQCHGGVAYIAEYITTPRHTHGSPRRNQLNPAYISWCWLVFLVNQLVYRPNGGLHCRDN